MNAEAHEAKPAGRSALLFIFLTVFIDLLGFGIVLPLLPVYSLDPNYALSETQLGLLFASFSGMQLVFAPMWGRLSDRIGRRPVLIGGLLGTSVSYLVFALSQGPALLFASRFMAGFFGANVSTAQAYIADVTKPEDRAKGMGLIGAAFGLGFTFGPLLGGELTRISLAAPGYAAAALSLAAATLGLWKLPEPARGKAPATRVFRIDQLREALRDGRIGLLFVLGFLFIFCFSGFESMFTRFGIECFPKIFHLAGSIAHPTREDVLRAAPVAGRYLAGIGIVSAFIQGGLIRRLVPRFGETKLAIAGPLFLAVSLLVVGLATSWWVVLVGCALIPFGIGLNNPAVNGLLSRATPEEEQGAFLGLNQSVSSMARMTGPVFAGWIYHTFGAAKPFVVASGVLTGSALLATYYRARYGATFTGQEGAATPPSS